LKNHFHSISLPTPPKKKAKKSKMSEAAPAQTLPRVVDHVPAIKMLKNKTSIMTYCHEHGLTTQKKQNRAARFTVKFTSGGKQHEYQIVSEYNLQIRGRDTTKLTYYVTSVPMVEISTNSGSDHLTKKYFISSIVLLLRFGGCTNIKRTVDREDEGDIIDHPLEQKWDDLDSMCKDVTKITESFVACGYGVDGFCYNYDEQRDLESYAHDHTGKDAVKLMFGWQSRIFYGDCP